MRRDFSPLQVWRLLEGGLWAMVVSLILLAAVADKADSRERRPRTVGHCLLLALPRPWAGDHIDERSDPDAIHPWNATTLAIAVGIGLASVAVASVTYRIVERPFLARKVKLRG